MNLNEELLKLLGNLPVLKWIVGNKEEKTACCWGYRTKQEADDDLYSHTRNGFWTEHEVYSLEEWPFATYNIKTTFELVVEPMRRRGWIMDLYNVTTGKFGCYFEHTERCEIACCDYQDTAALAICQAAFFALTGDGVKQTQTRGNHERPSILPTERPGG